MSKARELCHKNCLAREADAIAAMIAPPTTSYLAAPSRVGTAGTPSVPAVRRSRKARTRSCAPPMFSLRMPWRPESTKWRVPLPLLLDRRKRSTYTVKAAPDLVCKGRSRRSGGQSLVAVVQAADLGKGDNVSPPNRLDWPLGWRILV